MARDVNHTYDPATDTVTRTVRLHRLTPEAHPFEPSEEPPRHGGERRACAVCGATEGATAHGR